MKKDFHIYKSDLQMDYLQPKIPKTVTGKIQPNLK